MNQFINPIEYYTYVKQRYSEIIHELQNYDPKKYTISLDIDETILSDLSELSLEFRKFHNLVNKSCDEILYIRPKIPYSLHFVNSIKDMGFTIYIITAREPHRYEKTKLDLVDFPYNDLYLYDSTLWKNTALFKKEIRIKHNCIGIGDQPYDVDDKKFLIINPFY